MAANSRAVSVATTATQLDSTTDNDDGIPGQAIAIHNNGASTIYVGGSAVTTAAGLPLAAGASMTVDDLRPGEPIYGIVASGTVEARVLETGVQ